MWLQHDRRSVALRAQQGYAARGLVGVCRLRVRLASAVDSVSDGKAAVGGGGKAAAAERRRCAGVDGRLGGGVGRRLGGLTHTNAWFGVEGWGEASGGGEPSSQAGRLRCGVGGQAKCLSGEGRAGSAPVQRGRNTHSSSHTRARVVMMRCMPMRWVTGPNLGRNNLERVKLGLLAGRLRQKSLRQIRGRGKP